MITRSPLQDPRRNPDGEGTRRNVLEYNTHSSQFGPALDRHVTENLGVGPEFHIVLNNWDWPVGNSVAYSNTLSQCAVGANADVCVYEDISEVPNS